MIVLVPLLLHPVCNGLQVVFDLKHLFLDLVLETVFEMFDCLFALFVFLDLDRQLQLRLRRAVLRGFGAFGSLINGYALICFNGS